MLNNEFPPLGGGQANANYFLLHALAKAKDLSIDLITSAENREKKLKFTKNSEIFFLNIGKNGKNLHFQSIFDLLRFSWQALVFGFKALKKEKYDLMVAWSGVPAGFLAYVLNKLFSVPYVVLLRGSDVPFYEKRWESLDRFIFSWLSPIIWRNAKQVIANSDGLRLLALKAAPKQKISVIYNGVDTDFYRPPNKKTPNKKPVILSVGRLVERKGFDLLINACSSFSVAVQIVGEGPEKANLAALAKKLKVDLKLLGIKNKNELQKTYQQADIFVLASKNEGMSNALLEAMASGLPCIVSDTGGSAELVENNINGFVLRENTAEEVKSQIEYLLNNSQERAKMGENSRKKSLKMSWEKVAKQFLQMFR